MPSYFRISNLAFIYLISISFTFGQEPSWDEVRLVFEESEITALQTGMAVSHDGSKAAFVFEDRKLLIFDIPTARFISDWTLDFDIFHEIRFSYDDSRILLLEDTRLHVLDWKNKTVDRTVALPGEILAFDISKRGPDFVVATKKKAYAGDYEKGNLGRIMEPDGSGTIMTLSVNPVKEQVLISMGPLKRNSFIFDYKTGALVEHIPRYTMSIFDNSGTRMFTNNSKNHFVDYDINSGNSNTFQGYYGGLPALRDVYYFMDYVQMDNILIATANYIGFAVFDLNKKPVSSPKFGMKTRKIFSTKRTKGDKSVNPFKLLGSYKAKYAYPLNDDITLINGFGNNINQLYSKSQNKIVGYLFVDSNNDFTVISRDGRFDGKASASEKLFWSSRKSNRRTSLESTFAKGFTPRLLNMLLTSEQIVSNFDIDDEIDDIPEIEISAVDGQKVSGNGEIFEMTSNQRSVTIEVKVKSNADQINEVRLFQNNKLIGSRPVNNSNTLTFEAVLTQAFGNANHFYAQASSTSGIDSEKSKLIVNYTGVTNEKPKLFLVTIGVNEYRNPRYNLNYAIADADAFEKMIIERSSALFDSVINIRIRDEEFTREVFESRLELVRQHSKEQDMLIFYYAGHGIMSEGLRAGSDFYLVTWAITQLYGKDEILEEQAISARQLKEMSRKINAQKQLFLLDACQSAAAVESMVRGAAEERAIAQLARSTGTFWITATGSDQFATEFDSLGHGVFTYSLLEGLNGKADGSADNRVTVRELTAFIELRVPELAEQYKGTPQFPSGFSYGNDFPVVLYQGN